MEHARRDIRFVWPPAVVAAVLAAAASLPANADDAEDQFKVASGFFNMNRFDFAAEEYEKFLKTFPKHAHVADGTFFLGESYYQLNKLDLALARFREVVAKHAQSKNYSYALYRVGEVSNLLGDNKSAEPALSEFVTKRPDDPLLEFALPCLGRVQLALGKHAEAKTTLRAAIGKFPNGRAANQNRYDLAQTLERLGEKDAALEMYRVLASKDAGRFADDAQFAIGARLYDDKKYEPAAAAFADIERRFPQSTLVPTAKLNRALSLYQLQRFDQAQPLFESLVAGEPAVAAEATLRIGLIQRARGQHDAAANTLLDGYAKFAATDRAPELLFYAAQAAFARSDWKTAGDEFAEVAKKFPKHELAPAALFHAVEAARAAGQHDRVFALASQLYKDYPQSSDVNRTILAVGQSLMAQNRFDDAAKQFEALVARQPDSDVAVPARYYRAEALRLAKKPDEALAAVAPLLTDTSKDAAIAAVLADAQFLAGSCHFEKKDFAKAVAPLERYLALAPNAETAGAAVSYLAVCFANLGQFDRLRATLDTLRSKAGKDLSLKAIDSVAEACYAAKQYALAADLSNEVVQKDPQGLLHAKALSRLGWSRFEEKKFAPAADAFGQLVAAHPTDALAGEAAYLRGRALEADSKLPEAIAAYQLALAKFSQTPQAFDAALELARVLQRSSQLPQAIAAYADVEKRFPKHPKLDIVLNEWGWAHLAANQEADSQKIFERLAREFPNSTLVPEATLNAVETDFQAKRYADVVAKLMPLLAKQLAPNIRELALYRLGRTQVELAAWADARGSFESLNKEFPQSKLRREAAFWIAESERQVGRAKEALDLFAKLTAEPGEPEPWFGTAWLRLAQCQGELKQWKEMLQTLEQLRKRFPKFEKLNEADYHEGRAMQSLARFDESRSAYGRAAKGRSDETAAKSQFMIGETLFHQKRFQEALREYLKVEILYAFPQWQGNALVEAGKCHESLQEWSRAADAYKRTVEKYPNTTAATEATERLKSIQTRASANNSGGTRNP